MLQEPDRTAHPPDDPYEKRAKLRRLATRNKGWVSMQQRKTDKQRLREKRRLHRADRWEGFKLLVLLPLCSVVFTAVGLLMVVAAILAREGGAFGFALMALGLGVGMLGLSIVNYLEYFEARAARRSAPSDAYESGQKIVDCAHRSCPRKGLLLENDGDVASPLVTRRHRPDTFS